MLATWMSRIVRISNLLSQPYRRDSANSLSHTLVSPLVDQGHDPSGISSEPVTAHAAPLDLTGYESALDTSVISVPVSAGQGSEDSVFWILEEQDVPLDLSISCSNIGPESEAEGIQSIDNDTNQGVGKDTTDILNGEVEEGNRPSELVNANEIGTSTQTESIEDKRGPIENYCVTAGSNGDAEKPGPLKLSSAVVEPPPKRRRRSSELTNFDFEYETAPRRRGRPPKKVAKPNAQISAPIKPRRSTRLSMNPKGRKYYTESPETSPVRNAVRRGPVFVGPEVPEIDYSEVRKDKILFAAALGLKVNSKVETSGCSTMAEDNYVNW